MTRTPLDSRRCTKCGHVARYFDTRLGFCALVMPEGPTHAGSTRWYCGCKCAWPEAVDPARRAFEARESLERQIAAEAEKAKPPRDTPHDPSGDYEP